MFVDPSVISYINRCSEDSRKVKPVPPADRTGKHREQSDQKAGNASRRAAHHHNGRPLEDEYESSGQEGYAGYGGNPSENQEPREQRQKPDPEALLDPQIEKRLKQAYGVSVNSHPVDGFDTAA